VTTRAAGSALLFVFAGKLVSVAQYDLPLAVFAAVGLGAAQCPGLRLIAGVTGHVLKIDGAGEVIADDRQGSGSVHLNGVLPEGRNGIGRGRTNPSTRSER
jgi:hypothetical protein